MLGSEHSIAPLVGCITPVIPVTDPRLFDILQSGPWPTGGAAPDLDIVDRQSGDREWRQAASKWFNPTKGYGFIQPQGGGRDVFVHISAVERAGLSTLNEGQQIEYEVEENRGKTSAVNLKVK